VGFTGRVVMGPGVGSVIMDPVGMEGDVVEVMVVVMAVVGILGVVMVVAMVVVAMDAEAMAGAVILVVVGMEGVVVDMVMERMVDIIINLPPLHLTSSLTAHLPAEKPLQPFTSLMYSPSPSVLSLSITF